MVEKFMKLVETSVFMQNINFSTYNLLILKVVRKMSFFLTTFLFLRRYKPIF